jgi:hypothetical protein
MAALSWLRGKECFLPQTEWLHIPDSGVKKERQDDSYISYLKQNWLPIHGSEVKAGMMAAHPSCLKHSGCQLFPDSGVKNDRMAAYNSYLQQNGCLFILTLG